MAILVTIFVAFPAKVTGCISCGMFPRKKTAADGAAHKLSNGEMRGRIFHINRQGSIRIEA